MQQPLPQLEFLTSREIVDFLPLLRGLDELGDRFRLSMLHWCGYGQRPRPLDYWHIQLVRQNGTTISVCGLYRPPKESPDVVWLGWLGVLPPYRRQGIASFILKRMHEEARMLGAKEIRVFTESRNAAVQAFYAKNDYTPMGTAATFAPGQGSDPDDLVLHLALLLPK
jgi:GNAT superfamily N-acetyltransferase